MRPGETNLPETSITSALAGMVDVRADRGDTCRRARTMVPLGIVPCVTVRMVAPRSAMRPDGRRRPVR